MKISLGLLAVLVLPGVAAAQDTMPDDWNYRLDGDQALSTEQAVAAGQWRFTTMPPGWHVTTTEQGVTFFAKENVIDGRWGIEVELFLFPKPSDQPFGVVLEAADAAPGSTQLKFLMRRDGMATLVGRHDGAEEVMVPWTSDTAVKGHAGGVVKYVLRIMHEQETLSFAINGHEMLSVPTGGEDHRTVPGFRVGPGLNLHVSRYDLITPLAPPRER